MSEQLPDPIAFNANLDESEQNLTVGGGGMRIRLKVQPAYQIAAVGLLPLRSDLWTVRFENKDLPQPLSFRAHLAPCQSAHDLKHVE